MDATLHADADAITQLLYDGIVDSGDWYAGVELLRARMGAAFFHQMTVDCANGAVSDGLATFEAPQDKAREYEQHYARTDERMHAVLAMPAGSMVIDHERFDTSAISSSAIYSDWLPSVGLRHTVGLTLREDGSRKEVIGIMRAREDGMFRASEIALCQRALPHLARASALRARVAGLQDRAGFGLAALDALRQGIVVLDAQAAVQYANPAARALAAAGALCRVRHDTWRFADAPVQARFQQALAGACARGEPSCAGAFMVHTPQGPVAVSVLPLKAGHPLLAWRGVPLAMLSIGAGAQTDVAPPDLLRQALGVTLAEARLAHALAQGLTVKGYALRADLSEQTVRGHLKNLLRKTDCHRQVELVTLAQSVQAPPE
ncbi:helix-turn-helix transcriptional regulator [Bordetella bronchiseptica]